MTVLQKTTADLSTLVSTYKDTGIDTQWFLQMGGGGGEGALIWTRFWWLLVAILYQTFLLNSVTTAFV